MPLFSYLHLMDRLDERRTWDFCSTAKWSYAAVQKHNFGESQPFPRRDAQDQDRSRHSNCCSDAIRSSNLVNKRANSAHYLVKMGTKESEHSPQQQRSQLIAHTKRTRKGGTPILFYFVHYQHQNKKVCPVDLDRCPNNQIQCLFDQQILSLI